jgi:hypothetical protein
MGIYGVTIAIAIGGFPVQFARTSTRCARRISFGEIL